MRSAVAADAPAIAEVHVASWRAAYRGLLPEEYLDSRTVAVRTQQWESVLADPGPGHVLVAVLGDRVVGFAQDRPSGDAISISSTSCSGRDGGWEARKARAARIESRR